MSQIHVESMTNALNNLGNINPSFAHYTQQPCSRRCPKKQKCCWQGWPSTGINFPERCVSPKCPHNECNRLFPTAMTMNPMTGTVTTTACASAGAHVNAGREFYDETGRRVNCTGSTFHLENGMTTANTTTTTIVDSNRFPECQSFCNCLRTAAGNVNAYFYV